MANPFFIQPADYSQSLRGLTGIVNQYGQQQQQQQEKEQQQMQQQQLGEQASQLFKSGTPDEIAEFSLKNPQMGQLLSQQVSFKSDATKQNMMQGMQDIILNPANTEQILNERIAMVQAEGGDPTQTIAELEKYNADPDAYTNTVERTYALMDPKGYGAYKESMVKDESKPFQMGSGQMSGYTFDPNEGTYSIDPEIKQQLVNKAETKAAEGVNLGAKDRQSINKDVTGLLKDTVAVNKAAKSLRGLKKSSSAASKLAAVFAFMKSLDPTSVVRESEQGQVYSAQGAASNIAGMINGILGEGKLTDAGFDDLVATANNLADSAIDASGGEVQSYLDTYEDTIPSKFKNSLIKRIPSRNTKKAAVKDIAKPALLSAPAVGVVDSGYKFNGGDPKDPASWSKV